MALFNFMLWIIIVKKLFAVNWWNRKWQSTIILTYSDAGLSQTCHCIFDWRSVVNFTNILRAAFTLQILWLSTSILPTKLRPTLPVHSTRSYTKRSGLTLMPDMHNIWPEDQMWPAEAFNMACATPNFACYFD